MLTSDKNHKFKNEKSQDRRSLLIFVAKKVPNHSQSIGSKHRELLGNGADRSRSKSKFEEKTRSKKGIKKSTQRCDHEGKVEEIEIGKW